MVSKIRQVVSQIVKHPIGSIVFKEPGAVERADHDWPGMPFLHDLGKLPNVREISGFGRPYPQGPNVFVVSWKCPHGVNVELRIHAVSVKEREDDGLPDSENQNRADNQSLEPVWVVLKTQS